MIYECPQCKTPLAAGVMACAKCGLQFATPIPADATVPPAGAPTLTSTAQTSGFAPLASDGPASRRVLAVVAVLGVVLVAAALFAIYSFTRTPVSDAAPGVPSVSSLPPPPSAGLPPGAYTPRGPGTSAPAAAGGLAPVQLSGGSSSAGGTAAAAGGGDAALQGRWQAKNLDFYLFSADGTGARGNTTNPDKSDSFTWVVTDNQLVLNGKKQERLTFSIGPDASVLYLRLADGRYVKFARA